MPESNISSGIKIKRMPSKNFKIEGDRLTSIIIDNKEAIAQAIDGLVDTEKGENIILPYWYGTSIKSLIGKDINYIKVEAERILNEALATDDRIKGMEDFQVINYDSDSIIIKFVVNTIFGSITVQKEWR